MNWIGEDRYWENFPTAYGEFRREAKRRLQEIGIRVLDVSPALAKARSAGLQFFVDPVHLSAAGNRAVARIIAGRAPDKIAFRAAGEAFGR